MVTRWRTTFVNGQKKVNDVDRASCHNEAIAHEHVVLVKQLIAEDVCYTLNKLKDRLRTRKECSHSSI